LLGKAEGIAESSSALFTHPLQKSRNYLTSNVTERTFDIRLL
jgi:hypothetical protein